MDKLIGPFDQILTMAGMPLKGPLHPGGMEIIERSWIGIKSGKIAGFGKEKEMTSGFPEAVVVPIDGPAVLLPGFIDSHTHICWAGNRAGDHALRLEGRSYLEIAEAGGGIWSSVLECRAASGSALSEGIAARADHLLSAGVTTIEVKSGYGLQVEAEIKVLKAIAEAGRICKAELVPTCLAAHMKPKDFSGGNREYLDHLLRDLLPVIMSNGLSKRVDVFIEASAFDAEEGLHYLLKAKEMGFSLTVHGDQFTTGGSLAAIRAGAVSVDHLEASTESEIRALSGSDVITTVLPGASLGLGMPFAPARRLLDAGCCVAIASDWNPGSAPMGELLVQAGILAAYEKLNMAEILAGLTYRAAAALELTDRGVLSAGKRADMQAYPVGDYREIIYNQGRVRPHKVWVAGEPGIENGE